MRARLKTVTSWALMIGCTGFIVQLFASDEADVGLLSRLSLLDIAIITLLQVGLLLLGSFRYLLVVEKCSGQAIAFLPWLRIYVFARFINLVVPQAGNLYRGVRLKRLFQVSYTRYAGSFIAFAWIGTSLNLVIAAAAVALWAPEREIGAIPRTGGCCCLRSVLLRGRSCWIKACDAFRRRGVFSTEREPRRATL